MRSITKCFTPSFELKIWIEEKIKNWSQCNRALVQRKGINILLSDSAIEKWKNTENGMAVVALITI